MTANMPTHQVAVISRKGGPLVLESTKTLEPKPKELLIAVKAIALNPLDAHMRDMGLLLMTYPSVPGSDIAGTVESVGSEVPSSLGLTPGARVLAYAPAVFTHGEPAYGAFQTKVLVPAANAVVIPDSLRFVDAATLPMGVLTAWNGWQCIDIDLKQGFKPSDNAGVLIWSGASSVGVCAIQTAKSLGFVVFVTASPQHHHYLKKLGADYCFDYKSSTVASEVVSAAKGAGVSINHGYLTAGFPKPIYDVLVEFGGGKFASTIPPNMSFSHHPKVGVRFVLAPEGRHDGGKVLDEHLSFVFQEWLGPRLHSGEFIPAPKARVLPGGLDGLNAGLDILLAGVSNEKLVIEI